MEPIFDDDFLYEDAADEVDYISDRQYNEPVDVIKEWSNDRLIDHFRFVLGTGIRVAHDRSSKLIVTAMALRNLAIDYRMPEPPSNNQEPATYQLPVSMLAENDQLATGLNFRRLFANRNF